MRDKKLDTHYTTKEEFDALYQKTVAVQSAKNGRAKFFCLPDEDESPGARWRRIFRGVRRGLYLCAMLALCAVFITVVRAKRNGEVPSILGYYLFSIETGSMVPTLPIGSIILAQKPTDAYALAEGEIVTFISPDYGGALVTHRIFRVEGTDSHVVYITKGDNVSNEPDPTPLEPEKILGVYRLTITLPVLW